MERAASSTTIGFSLRLKLVVLITAAVVTTGVLLVLYNFRRSRASLEDELRKRGTVIAENLSDAAPPILVTGSRDLDQLCQSFADEGDVAYVLVADPSGKPLAHVARERAGRIEPGELDERGARAAAMARVSPERRIETATLRGGGEVFAVSVPVFIVVKPADEGGDAALFGMEAELSPSARRATSRRVEAVVEVGISLATLRRTERDMLFKSVGIVALVVLIGLFSSLVIAGLVVRPVNQVAAASEAIAHGDLAVRLPTRRSGDELNKLAVFFNHMAEELDRQRREVTTLTEELTRQRDQERALRDVAVMINSAASVAGLVDGLFARISTVVGSHAGVFYAWDPTSERLLPLGAYAVDPHKLAPLELGEGTAGQAAKERQRVLARGVPSLPVPILGQPAPASSVAAVPIVFQDRLLAVIEVATFGEFDAARLEFLSSLAEQGAVALNNLYTHERTVELARELAAKKVELERQNEHKSAFLANMSHELRTPLNSIIGFTRLVQKKAGDALPSQQQENLGKVEKSAVNLLGIINDILDISKIEAGKLDVTPEPLVLAELVDEVLSQSGPLVGDKPLRLVKRVPPSIPELVSDRLRIRQVILNLVSNAIKFTPAGEVAVEVEHDVERDRIAIAVVDTGIGIPDSERDRVFEAFRQVDNSTTRRVGGTGLGLAIVRRLCELLGGSIRLDSELARGSRFTVELPRVLVDERAGSVASPPAPASNVISIAPALRQSSNKEIR